MEVKLGNLGLVSTTEKRVIKSTRYDRLFEPCDWKETIIRPNGDLDIVIEKIFGVIKTYQYQVNQFAPTQRAKTIYQTCRNLWNFWYSRCNYLEDIKGREQLRTPARSYWEGNLAGYGIDCDDFSITLSCCLSVLGIPHRLRIARYEGVEHFQHIYVIAHDGERDIILDCVLDYFDSEKPPAEIRDFPISVKQDKNYQRTFYTQEKNRNMASKTNLSGIDIAILSGVGESSPLLDLVSGSDFAGIGSTDTPDAIYNHLVKTRELVQSNPELIREVEHPETFLKLIDYALKHWHTPQRDEALRRLSEQETRINGLLGSGSEETIILDYQTDLSGVVVGLGRVAWQRKFFDRVKEAVQNQKENVKDAGQALVKYNPLTVAARAGVLLAMKTNLFQIAETLKWGYLSPDQAASQGFDTEEYTKAKHALSEAEHIFVRVLQGSPETFRHTILSGRAGGLNGISFGVVEPVSAATTTAASVPFLAKLKAFASKVNVKKLLSKVNPSRLLKKSGASDQNEKTPKQNEKLINDGQGAGENPPPPPPNEETGLPAWAVPAALLVSGGLLLMSSGKEKLSGISGLGTIKRNRNKKQKQSASTTRKTKTAPSAKKKPTAKPKPKQTKKPTPKPRKVVKTKKIKPEPFRLVGTKTGSAKPRKKNHTPKSKSKPKTKNGKTKTLYL